MCRISAKLMIPVIVAVLMPLQRLSAQETARPDQLYMPRSDLAAALDFYERSAASPAYSERLQARAEEQGGAIRARLEDGDFQVGDRIVVSLENQGIEYSDTLLVEQGRIVRVPDLGEVELEGVLRSELGERLQEFFEQYVREPRLFSRSLVRFQLAGSVATPGFFTMPSETPLPDAIMLAGGPVGDVDLNAITIERRGRRILSGDAVREALAEGRTLDELGLQGGDQIMVPRRFPLGAAESAVRTVGMLLALPLSIAGLIALFS
jgi:hypothetical protein